ncbi:MAG TPA: OmpH family outer membrane protein, partial [Cyclobacteriaceae bacterium]
MKTLLAIAVCLLIHATVSAQELKIGYANVDYIFSKLPEVKRIESDLKVLQTNLESRIETNYIDFQKKLANYQSGYDQMAAHARADKERELQTLQQSIEKLQKDAQKKQFELVEPVYAQIDKAIRDIAVENHFSFILNEQAGES